jgi:hypothetical protein
MCHWLPSTNCKDRVAGATPQTRYDARAGAMRQAPDGGALRAWAGRAFVGGYYITQWV